jgi:phosphohistidine swiveling domain-containing protein
MKTAYIPGYNPTTGEWNDSLTCDHLWSSVNTREAVPDVMTPYTWSAIRTSFDQMTMLPGYPPLGNICGRAYNNGSVGATVFGALGLKTFDAPGSELYGVDSNSMSEWDVPLVPFGFTDRLQVLRNGLRVMNKVRRTLKNLDARIAGNPAWCETERRRFHTLNKLELLAWVDNTLMPRLIECFWWMGSTAISQSGVVSKLRSELLKRVGAEDSVALLSNVSGEVLLASLGPVVGLDRVRRGLMSREEYILKYGHRSPHEVEISTPRPAENPDWIEEQIEGLSQSPTDVDALLREQRKRYEAALDRLHKSSPRDYESLLKRLKEAARLTLLREEARSESIRLVWMSREFALRAGELTDLGEDIFFLENDEVIELIKGRKSSVAFIPARKETYKKYSALPLYPTIIVGRFDPFTWAADPNRPTDIYDPRQRIKKQFTNTIKGLPGSAGHAEGMVRVLHSPEQGEQLQQGEILVAVTTNVGWTPIFPRAAAVITDVGAPLSHAAIVARELGIPAVVGCFNATQLLQIGDRVRVDGASGLVEILRMN